MAPPPWVSLRLPQRAAAAAAGAAPGIQSSAQCCFPCCGFHPARCLVSADINYIHIQRNTNDTDSMHCIQTCPRSGTGGMAIQSHVSSCAQCPGAQAAAFGSAGVQRSRRGWQRRGGWRWKGSVCAAQACPPDASKTSPAHCA